MPFEKGNDLGKGRPKGAVNALTRTFRDLLLKTIEEVNDTPGESLRDFARNYPKEFWQIAAKLIPVKVDAVVNDANYIPRATWATDDPVKIIDITDSIDDTQES